MWSCRGDWPVWRGRGRELAVASWLGLDSVLRTGREALALALTGTLVGTLALSDWQGQDVGQTHLHLVSNSMHHAATVKRLLLHDFIRVDDE